MDPQSFLQLCKYFLFVEVSDSFKMEYHFSCANDECNQAKKVKKKNGGNIITKTAINTNQRYHLEHAIWCISKSLLYINSRAFAHYVLENSLRDARLDDAWVLVCAKVDQCVNRKRGFDHRNVNTLPNLIAITNTRQNSFFRSISYTECIDVMGARMGEFIARSPHTLCANVRVRIAKINSAAVMYTPIRPPNVSKRTQDEQMNKNTQEQDIDFTRESHLAFDHFFQFTIDFCWKIKCLVHVA